ncbi:MAG: YkgJ family cysteine cluster protein [Lentisphaeria bacterium]|nr:YkgJ family cysteine cluster protein [Lentisphaeria bacterium]
MAVSEEKKVYLCTGCGDCCRWPGYVHINNQDVDAIAEYLDMPEQDFLDKYTDLTHDRKGLTLIEKENHHCIFFNDAENMCKIYPVRPKQCSGFPNTWTVSNLESKCPAIPLHYKVRKLSDKS